MSCLVWHRRGDLRLDDNELYHVTSGPIVSLFVVDVSDLQHRPVTGSRMLSTVNLGPFATAQLLVALKSLKNRLSAVDGRLLIRHGDPIEIVANLAEQLGIDVVAWSELPGDYEQRHSERLKKRLSGRIKVRIVCTYSLWHPDDLPRFEHEWHALARPKEERKLLHKPMSPPPTPDRGHIDVSSGRLTGMPTVMGDFRRAARSSALVRDPLPCPTSLQLPDSCPPADQVPKLTALLENYRRCNLFGLDVADICDQARIYHEHDEKAAQKHLLEFVQQHAAHADRSLADTSSHQSSVSGCPWACFRLVKCTRPLVPRKEHSGLCHTWRCVTFSSTEPFSKETDCIFLVENQETMWHGRQSRRISQPFIVGVAGRLAFHWSTRACGSSGKLVTVPTVCVKTWPVS